MPALFMALAVTSDTDPSFLHQVAASWATWSTKGPWSFLLTLATGLLIVLVGKLLIVWLCRLLEKALARAKKINNLMARFIVQVVNIFGWIFLIIMFLQHMGIDMGPVLAGLGITGIILGLAFQETLGNLLSGVMIVINAPFSIGDYVDAGSYSGTVTNMDLICVTLSTPDNKKITIANKLVWGSPIVNYSNMERRRVDITLGVAYGSDLDAVKDVVRALLASYPEILADPLPTVEVQTLSASSIDFIVRPWVAPADYWKVYWRFQGDICGKLEEAGISIPFNQLDVHLVSETGTTEDPAL